MSWETVIGLEIHAQLSTKSKLFSGGSTEFGAESNTHVDLIDMGLPGVLPVANKEAFYKAIRFGLATGAEINQVSSFDRKNYFYPDLPKGYQITQMTKPIIEKGSIKIFADDSEKVINITRAHQGTSFMAAFSPSVFGICSLLSFSPGSAGVDAGLASKCR